MPYLNFNRPARRRGVRGFGDVSCPSMEQLLGIVDPSDPCQASSLGAQTPVTSSGTPLPTQAACPSVEQLAGIVDPQDPCQAANSSSSSTATTAVNSFSTAVQNLVKAFTTPAPTASTEPCFTPAFPWIGSNVGGVCQPAMNIPAPWGTVITGGVVLLLILGLTKKR